VHLAADLDTSLLYVQAWQTIFIANEQEVILYQFPFNYYFEEMYVSCNVILKHDKTQFILYNQHGKQISQVEDKRIQDSNICLVHDKGVVVVVTKDNQIHLWRVV
jgi:hypothetical protein